MENKKMENRKRYWEGKAERAAQAKRHTEDMESRFAEEIFRCVQDSKEYTGWILNIPSGSRQLPEIHVQDIDTVSAIMECTDTPVAVLNFASYKEPGGKFLEGSRAQEECLCHASCLYNILREKKEFYRWNQEMLNRGLYMDRAIFTPDVHFFKGNEWRMASVITCAAPNLYVAKKYQNISDRENTETLDDRIKFILNVAETEQVYTLILGAWGCGVFGQSPLEVASLFRKNLAGRRFGKVIFAIPKGDDGNYEAFRGVFPENTKKDSYKVQFIDSILERMKEDSYYVARVKGDDTEAIDLDEEALSLLKAFFEGRKINIQ